MRPHEFLALALLCAASAAPADPPDYGRVNTFQPGKKYNCVPTADRKGWDCKETGKADIPVAPPPVTPPERPPEAAPAPVAAPAAPPAHAATPHSSTLPSYLTDSGANQPMQPMHATPATKPAPKPRVKGPMMPERTPGPEKSAPEPVPAPAVPPAPVQTQSVPTRPSAEPAPASLTPAPTALAHDFLALPATGYVIELAHADSKAGLDAARAAAHPAHGKVYELHLQQNGIDAWLLLWGPFDDLESARTARAELAAQGANPGWPRRMGPLQAELRHTEQ